MVMEQSSFRQVEDRHVSVEVSLMIWSPKIDLIAIANVQGEVVLHRLSWQKVWSIPPVDGVTVAALAWRPDSKVLAIGYSTGKICLCHIENAEVLHELEVPEEISCMNWVSQTFPEDKPWLPGPYPEDASSKYLPKLEPLNKSYSTLAKGHMEDNVEDAKKVKNQKELNLLLVGTSMGHLFLYSYGIFPSGSVTLPMVESQKSCRVESAMISQDLYMLTLVVDIVKDTSDEDHNFYLASVDTTLLASRHKELRLLALIHAELSSLSNYLQSTIQQMTEAWEDILMEMDAKLMKFAEEKKLIENSRSVCTDFLELLLMGMASSELRMFLLHELTEKGLKKLGLSVESSYVNIQKLVGRLHNVGLAMTSHLSDLKGMSLWYDRFGILGLNSHSLHEAVAAAGAFMLKSSELNQVIDRSIKSLKAFFRWLYVAILRLADPPQELSKMTQHDYNFVAEFIKENFEQLSLENTDSKDGKKPGFKLEKVGQYMKKEDLQFLSNNSKNPWAELCQSCPNLKDSPLLYPVYPKKSLIQVQQHLESSINAALNKPTMVIGSACQCTCMLYLYSKKEDKLFSSRITQFSVAESNKLYTVFTASDLPCEKFYVIRQLTHDNRNRDSFEVAAVSLRGLEPVSQDVNKGDADYVSKKEHKILDVAFYDEKTLSVLLVEETGDPILTQVPLSVIKDKNFTSVCKKDDALSLAEINTVDVGDQIDAMACRRLENMKAHSFAVSGSRKVAAVLFLSRRRLRVFLMDVEEEEELDDTVENPDKSQTEDLGQETGHQDDVILDTDDENKENASTMETE